MKVGQTESIEVWDEGTYPAMVVDVVEEVSNWPGKEGTPRLRIVFRVVAETGEHTDVWHYTNATLSTHRAAKLRPIIATLRPDLNLDDPGLELELGHPDGQRPSPDDVLVGCECRVILGLNAEKGRNQIDKVLSAEVRPRQGGPRRPAPAPATNGAKAPF